MEQDYLTRNEHLEFAKRMEEANQRIMDENSRQNHRIERLERVTEQLNALTRSVDKMAVTMENMIAEQSRQSAQLKEIAERPSKRWETLISGILGAVAGAVGMGLAAAVAGFIK